MSEAPPSRRSQIAATVAIAATYFYFLIFAEFALLVLAQPFANQGWSLRLVMGLLGAGGIAGGAAAAFAYRPGRFIRALQGGFLISAAAAAITIAARTGAVFVFGAAMVGLGLGWLTVTLAAGLRTTVGLRRLGLVCGFGTGAAYACCNLPGVFALAAVRQAQLAVVVAIGGAMVASFLEVRAQGTERAGEHTRGRTAAWIVALAALVWLDSAAFWIIQHTPALKAGTWTGAWLLGGNALTHLVAAIAAGWVLDQGWFRRLFALATLLLLAACWQLRGAPMLTASILYTAGVSLYSTVLVYYPARSGRPAIAALVYSVAGWIGSAAGIGMAEHLLRIPPWYLVLTAAVVGAVLLGRIRKPLAAGSILAAIFALPIRSRAASETDLVQLGREVYISEGCMHCHSQYVRPRVAADVAQWGPSTDLSSTLADTPPLFGNRRQGPDLAAVGNRRSDEWQRLHLMAPRSIVPGSRMPDYPHLFRNDERGEALVRYLASLGRDTLPDHFARAAKWQPTLRPDEASDPVHGQKLFAHWCTGCHGQQGRGDGALAGKLSVKPPDWARDSWRHVSADNGRVEIALARIVKFGLPGSPMAGHEYFSDADAVALARFVESLHLQSPRT